MTYDEQHFYYDPRPSGLRGELAFDQHLSDAIEDIPPVSTLEEPAPKVVEEAPEAVEDAPKISPEKGKKSSKKAKKRTGAADSSPAARWARWRQEKEQDREIVIPRGPNLDACSSEEASAVSAFMTSDAQAVVVDSIREPGATMPASSLEASSAAETQTAEAAPASSFERTNLLLLQKAKQLFQLRMQRSSVNCQKLNLRSRLQKSGFWLMSLLAKGNRVLQPKPLNRVKPPSSISRKSTLGRGLHRNGEPDMLPP